VSHLLEVFLGEGVAEVSRVGEPEVVDLDDEYCVGAEVGSCCVVVVCLDSGDGGSLDLGVGGLFEDGGARAPCLSWRYLGQDFIKVCRVMRLAGDKGLGVVSSV
jgi:hypothetical protein